MALRGEGDPRWVVRERQDGRNVNGWHWEDKDVSNWAKQRIKQLLTCEICKVNCKNTQLIVKSVETVDGDATLYNRKGILKVLYDLKVSGKWSSMENDDNERTYGDFKFELFDEEPEVVVIIDPKSKGEHLFKTSFQNHITPIIRDQCGIFIKEMHQGAGQSVEGLTVPVTKKKEKETKVTDYLRSGMNQKATVKKTNSTSRLIMKEIFVCNSMDIYLAFTDRARLEAITRSKVISDATVGGKLNLMNNTIVAEYKTLLVGQEIRLSWKLKTWGDENDASDVIIKFEEDEGKTTVEVIIETVPNEHKSATEGFWRVQMFQATKIVMGWGSASSFL